MSINPKNIIMLLEVHFYPTQENLRNSKFSQSEINLAENFISTIEEAINQKSDVEFLDDLVFDYAADFSRKEGELDKENEFSDVEEESDEDENASTIDPSYEPSPKKPRKSITFEQKKKALEFYRGPAKGVRSLSKMMHDHKWIKSESDLTMLRRFEKTMQIRIEAYKALNEKLFQVFIEKRRQNAPIGDQDLRRWAIKINKEMMENRIHNFKGSKNWLDNFKKSKSVVSRKITKFVTKRQSIDNEKIKENAAKFVQETRQLITDLRPELVINTDQSGFLQELHWSRTLEIVGTKTVQGLAQSISATTHSYTICPIVSSDGTLAPQMLMVLAEASGEFPKIKPVEKAQNIKALPGKSHIMTKGHAEIFAKEILAPYIRGRKTILLVDAWSTWRNALKNADIGDNVTVKEIPAGCTGIVQPCDLYLFRTWKEMVRKFSDRVILDDLPVNLHQRDSMIRLQSLVYNQLSAERFQTFLKYSWHKGGYLDEDEEIFKEFPHPVKFCYPNKFPESCDIIGCENSVLIRCGHCSMFLCFTCFFSKNPYHFHTI